MENPWLDRIPVAKAKNCKLLIRTLVVCQVKGTLILAKPIAFLIKSF